MIWTSENSLIWVNLRIAVQQLKSENDPNKRMHILHNIARLKDKLNS